MLRARVHVVCLSRAVADGWAAMRLGLGRTGRGARVGRAAHAWVRSEAGLTLCAIEEAPRPSLRAVSARRLLDRRGGSSTPEPHETARANRQARGGRKSSLTAKVQRAAENSANGDLTLSTLVSPRWARVRRFIFQRAPDPGDFRNIFAQIDPPLQNRDRECKVTSLGSLVGRNDRLGG